MRTDLQTNVNEFIENENCKHPPQQASVVSSLQEEFEALREHAEV